MILLKTATNVLKQWLFSAQRHITYHVTCQKNQLYFKMFRTLKPYGVLRLVKLPLIPFIVILIKASITS